MNTLYEITGEYLQLLDMLDSADEMEDQVIRDTLDGVEGELEIKAENYAKIIKELKAEAEKFEAEKKRLESRVSTLNNRVRILKDSLSGAMRLTGKLKFRTDLFSFGIQRNGGVQPMELLPDVDIPDEYARKEPDTDKIRKALQSGQELPFAVLKERGEHLVIR